MTHPSEQHDARAIETLYKGYKFRSRTEARWAVCFDALGLEWAYEPQGYNTPYGWYLPDFFIYDPFDARGVWVEVKGAQASTNELAKFACVCATTQRAGMILSGRPETADGTQWAGVTPLGYTYTPESYDVAWGWRFFHAGAGWLARGFYPLEGDEMEAVWDKAVELAQNTDFNEPWMHFPDWCLAPFSRDNSTCGDVPRTENALQTVYNGTAFRRRLDARWAVLFDALEVGWEYLPGNKKKVCDVDGDDATFRLCVGDLVFWMRLYETRPHAATDAMVRLYHLCDSTGQRGAAVWGDPASIGMWDTRVGWIGATSDERNEGFVSNCHDSMPWALWALDSVNLSRLSFSSRLEFWRVAAGAARSARFEHGQTPEIPWREAMAKVPHVDPLGTRGAERDMYS